MNAFLSSTKVGIRFLSTSVLEHKKLKHKSLTDDFLKNLANKLKIKSFEDWFSITKEDVQEEKGGNRLIKAHKNIPNLLQTLLGQEMEPWLFRKLTLPSGYWKETENQKKFVVWLSQKLNIKKLEDWYNVDPLVIRELGGSGFLEIFDNRLDKLLTSFYPEISWKPWLFKHQKVPNGYWSYKENQRNFIEWIAEKYDLKLPRDLNKIKTFHFSENGGKPMLEQYNGSAFQALKINYPEINWEPSTPLEETIGEKVGKRFWGSSSNQRDFFDAAFKALNLKSMEDWYHVTARQIENIGGATVMIKQYGNSIMKIEYLKFIASTEQIRMEDWYSMKGESLMLKYPKLSEMLKQHHYSLASCLMSNFPEYKWEIERFDEVSTYHRNFFESLAKKLNIIKPTDWYKLKHSDIVSNGGSTILDFYNNSIFHALRSVYPTYSFEVWKFSKIDKSYWEDLNNQRAYLDKLGDQFFVKSLSDWSDISVSDVIRHGGSPLLNIYGGSLQRALEAIYPDFPWNKSPKKWWDNQMSKGAIKVYKVISELLPKENIEVNYHHPFCRYQPSNYPMIFDIYLPDLDIAIDFQGEMWFKKAPFFPQAKQKDDKKQIECNKNGITFIEVPYWWDGTQESLKSTLLKARKDLSNKIKEDVAYADPIPDEPSEEFKVNDPFPDVPMPKIYEWQDSKFNPENWWISEKIEGIYVIWDGHSSLYLRKFPHKQIKAPKFFVEQFPNLVFEGILSENEQFWESAKLTVTDTPSQTIVFESRMKILNMQIASNPYLSLNTSIKCTGTSHLQSFLNKGSSAVLRPALSLYYDKYSFAIARPFIAVTAKILEKLEGNLYKVLLLNNEIATIETEKQLAINSVVSIKKEQTGKYSFHKLKLDEDWEELTRNKYPFFISEGASKGLPPSCIGCRNEKRLQTFASLSSRLETNETELEIPRRVKLNICISQECLETGIKRMASRPFKFSFNTKNLSLQQLLDNLK